MSDPATIDEVCAVAMAEAFRGDGEILCNPIGTTPIIGGRLARATFEPDMVMTDAVSVLAANILPVGDDEAPRWSRPGCPTGTCSTSSGPAAATS